MPVVAIDGPSASGKGTVAALVADALGFAHLDSGALYRIVALAALRKGVPIDDEVGLAALAAAGLGQVEVLSDVDYLAKLAQAAPEEVQAVARQTGIDAASLAGIVRSLTYRAHRV